MDEPKLERAWIISFLKGMEQRLRVSSSDITKEKRSNISSAIGGVAEENKFVKWETKDAPIVALSDNQEPEFVFKKLTALDLFFYEGGGVKEFGVEVRARKPKFSRFRLPQNFLFEQEIIKGGFKRAFK